VAHADGDYHRLSELAGELVAAKLAVIVGYGTAAAKALKSATRNVPVVVPQLSIWLEQAS